MAACVGCLLVVCACVIKSVVIWLNMFLFCLLYVYVCLNLL